VPVRHGDEFCVRLTIVEARESQSKPDRGVFRICTQVLNQKREIGMTFTSTNFMRKRPIPA
jgi:acyl dehydratase